MKSMFEGAGVVISLPNRIQKKAEGDIYVETKYARELSAIYFKLKECFRGEIDYFSKYEFYGRIAENYNALLEKNGDVKKNLRLVLLTLRKHLYFAYGSNMSREQMEMRCPGAIYVGRGILKGYQFVIDSVGYASVSPSTEDVVEGAVWLINEQNEESLDRYEGVNASTPCYSKETVEVMLEDEIVEMLIYISKREITNKATKQEYIKRVVEAAKDIGLTPKYIRKKLERFVVE